MCIPTNAFTIFYLNYPSNFVIPDLSFEIFKYFYSDICTSLLDDIISSNKNYDLDFIVEKIILYFGRDKNILQYCLDLKKKNNLVIIPDLSNYKLPLLNHTLKYVKYYSTNLYNINSMQFICNDNKISDFINIIFSEEGIRTFEKPLYSQRDKEIFIKYNINLKNVSNYKIINNNENILKSEEIINNNKNITENKEVPIEERYFKYNTKNILIRTIDSQHSKILFNNYNFKTKKININNFSFVKHYLNDINKINEILKDPNYILNLNLNIKNYIELLIIKICYIISLIHNKVDKFIIYVLIYNINKTYKIYYINNKICLYKYFSYNKYMYEMFNILSNTSHVIFNNYFEIFEYVNPKMIF